MTRNLFVITSYDNPIPSSSIFILQKKCLRHVANVTYNAHTNSLFSKHKIFKFHDLVKLKTCIFLYKLCNHLVPTNLLSLFSLEYNTRYSTRQNQNIRERFARTTKKAMCLSVNGIKKHSAKKLREQDL